MMIAEHLRSADERRSSRRSSSRGSTRSRERGYEMMASLQTAGVYNLSAPVLGPGRQGYRRADHPLHHAGQLSVRARHHHDDQLLQSAAGEAFAARRLGCEADQLNSYLNDEFLRENANFKRWRIAAMIIDTHLHIDRPVARCAIHGLPGVPALEPGLFL